MNPPFFLTVTIGNFLDCTEKKFRNQGKSHDVVVYYIMYFYILWHPFLACI